MKPMIKTNEDGSTAVAASTSAAAGSIAANENTQTPPTLPHHEDHEDLCSSKHATQSAANVSPLSPAMSRTRLEQTKSMALSELMSDKHPVAPPRYKKRQSVPVNNEYMLRRQQRLRQKPGKQNSADLEQTMIKVEHNERPLECGHIEHTDTDVSEIDRPAGCDEDMKQNQREQQQHQSSSGGTLTTLFTKLMGKLSLSAPSVRFYSFLG